MLTFLQTLLTSVRSRFTSTVARFRLFTSAAWWRTQGIAKLRQFFRRLFDIKPKHKGDYYPIFRWLVSKKLAFAIVVVVGTFSLYYLLFLSPYAPSGSSGDRLRTFKYSAFALKFQSGRVGILAHDKHIAYIGMVEKGHASGEGSLYDKENRLVYEGSFENSMFNGKGILYYPDGAPRYTGDFVNNLFEGKGVYRRGNGVVEYIGGYLAGLRSGEGELYNSGGNLVFTGNFLLDHLQYNDFLGKTASDAAELYIGDIIVYDSGDEYCALMRDIGAIYAADGVGGSIGDEPVIRQIFVLEADAAIGGNVTGSIAGLSRIYGAPFYEGYTQASITEALALNVLDDPTVGRPKFDVTSDFDEIKTVNGYESFNVYIYVYPIDGLVYTFYCEDQTAAEFLFYAVEQE